MCVCVCVCVCVCARARADTDRGTATCVGRPGSQGYESIDAKTYAEWGVDLVKEDSCSAPTDHNASFAQYGLMRDALNATGRPIYFALCGWSSWYAPVGSTLGNSWRYGKKTRRVFLMSTFSNMQDGSFYQDRLGTNKHRANNSKPNTVYAHKRACSATT
jgi:hypothetical protein